MDGGGGAQRWPTVPGGLGGERDWTPVEVVVAQLLADLAGSSALVEGDGVTLSYLPFTDLGLDQGQGEALCWEVMLSRGGAVEQIGLGERPLLALGDLPSAGGLGTVEAGAGGVGPDGGSTSSGPWGGAGALQHGWAGWSVLLRQAAVIASTGPASPEEPSIAGFDVEAVWSVAPGAWGWVWQAGGMEVLDAAGQSVGVRWWQGATPAAALRAALGEADTWWLDL